MRDKIPEFVRQDGKLPVIHTAKKAEYIKKLREKLDEEVAEFLKSGDTEAIADILEVLYAILDLEKISRSYLERVRKKKMQRRGAFAKRIILDEIKTGSGIKN